MDFFNSRLSLLLLMPPLHQRHPLDSIATVSTQFGKSYSLTAFYFDNRLMNSTTCKNQSSKTNNRKDQSEQNQESWEGAHFEHTESVTLPLEGAMGAPNRTSALPRQAKGRDPTISAFHDGRGSEQPLRRLLFPMKRKTAALHMF